jgi:VanZ family protein
MCLIFSASADRLSANHSSRIIEPILHWLFPHLDQDSLNRIVFLVRKCAHLTEYAILGLLIWRATRQQFPRDPRPWHWGQAGLALLITTLYASSDEIHQLYVKNREGRFLDVVIDASGAALGLLALWLLGKWRKRW